MGNFTRWVVLGCWLGVALNGMAAEYLGKAVFQRAGGLWVQELPDGVARQVVTGTAIAPCISNSGRWLRYLDNTGKRYVVDLQSATAKPHLQTGADRAQCSDDQIQVYTNQSGGIYLLRPGERKEAQLLPGVRRKRGSSGYIPGSIEDISLSPNGRQVAYVILRRPRRHYVSNYWNLYGEIHVIGIDGRGERTLLHDSGSGTDLHLSGWTPDGRYLLYQRAADQSASVWGSGVPLYAQPIAGGRPRLLANAAHEFAISPDGRQVAVSNGRGRWAWTNRQLILANTRTGEQRALTAPTDIAISPSWSPQEGSLAFVTAPAITLSPAQSAIAPALARRHIMLQTLPGGAAHPLTGDTVNREENPRWSADGNHLLYARITPAGEGSVWVWDMQPGRRRHIQPLDEQPPPSRTRQVIERIEPVPGESSGSQWEGYYGDVPWSNSLLWWRGERLAAPGWTVNGYLWAPLRPVVEALGGAVTGDTAHHSVTVMLDGQSRRYVYKSDAGNPNPNNGGLYAWDGNYYYPLDMLAEDFHLLVSWNGPAAEAVVNDSHAARIAIFPSRRFPALRTASSGTFPLLHVSPAEAYLVGGIAQQRFLDDVKVASALREQQYTVYTQNAHLGICRAGEPRRDTEGGGYGEFVKITPPARRDAYALAAPWNALPRAPQPDDPNKAVYQQIARQVLASRGMANVTPHITGAFTCDLKGNGQPARIISVTTPTAFGNDPPYYGTPKAGDYSFVAVQMHGRTRVITGDFFPVTPPASANNNNNSYTIAAFLDVDGDGREEVIIGYKGWEWSGEEVYRVTPTGINFLYSCYEGGI